LDTRTTVHFFLKLLVGNIEFQEEMYLKFVDENAIFSVAAPAAGRCWLYTNCAGQPPCSNY
jgi:hypothetical protein